MKDVLMAWAGALAAANAPDLFVAMVGLTALVVSAIGVLRTS